MPDLTPNQLIYPDFHERIEQSTRDHINQIMERDFPNLHSSLKEEMRNLIRMTAALDLNNLQLIHMGVNPLLHSNTPAVRQLTRRLILAGVNREIAIMETANQRLQQMSDELRNPPAPPTSIPPASPTPPTTPMISSSPQLDEPTPPPSPPTHSDDPPASPVEPDLGHMNIHIALNWWVDGDGRIHVDDEGVVNVDGTFPFAGEGTETPLDTIEPTIHLLE